MNVRIIVFISFLVSLLGTGTGYYLLRIYDCGNSIFCYNLTTKSYSLYYGMLALAVVFLLLTIFPNAFRAWKHFALWFIPFAVEIFIFYEGGTYDPYPEQVFRWLSALYVFVSVGIITISTVRGMAGKVTQAPWSRRRKIVFWTAWVLYLLLLAFPHLRDLFWYLTS